MSRFLNKYKWLTRKLIRIFRPGILQQILSYSHKGRRPHLQAIIDLTTLEKRGDFKDFQGAVNTYNHKRGLHLVVLYLVVGRVKVPCNWRIYRGKGTISPANLPRFPFLRVFDNPLIRFLQTKLSNSKVLLAKLSYFL